MRMYLKHRRLVNLYSTYRPDSGGEKNVLTAVDSTIGIKTQ